MRSRIGGEPVDLTGVKLAFCRHEPRVKAYLSGCMGEEMTVLRVWRNRAHQSGQDLLDGRVRSRTAARSNRKSRAHRTLVQHQVASVALCNTQTPVFLGMSFVRLTYDTCLTAWNLPYHGLTRRHLRFAAASLLDKLEGKEDAYSIGFMAFTNHVLIRPHDQCAGCLIRWQ